MKKSILFLFAAVILFSSWISVPRALAMPSESSISVNCQTAQSVLNQLEKSDAVLRVNRGRSYNNTLDLLLAMNARLANNRLSAPWLVELTSEFNVRLSVFRGNYDHYDDKLNNLIKFNCSDNPFGFYEKLNEVREARAQLADDISRLDKIIAEYSNELKHVTKGAI